MSTAFAVYVGPFAEWLVPKSKHHRIWKKWQALVEDFFESERGCLSFDPCTREVVVGRKRFIRECWTAYFGLAPEAKPPRQFHWADHEIGVWEIADLDIEQEKEWLERTFNAELRQLAAIYGCEPTIKWGTVTSRG